MGRNRESRTGIAVLAFIVASATAQFNSPAGCTSLPNGLYSSGCTHAFVQCDNGAAYPLECPAGLVFDKRGNRCVWPAECTSEVSPTLPTMTMPSRPSDAPSTVYDMKEEKEQMVTDAPLPLVSNDGSVCTGTGRRAMGRCSSGFVQCIGGKMVARRCPGQSLFDEKIGLCVYDLDGCEMDVEEVEVTDQETTVAASITPQQDASTGYGSQPVEAAPSYPQQTGAQQYPQSSPRDQYPQNGYQQTQATTQYQSGYPTDYQTVPTQEYPTGYHAAPAQEYSTGYQPATPDAQYQSGEYSSVPVHSSFDDSSLSPQSSLPECDIGSFRRVSACSPSFDECSPTARQWIRRICGKSHRFDSTANKCRPIFEVRECDEPLSSYVPPPVQSDAPALYPHPSSFEYGVPLSGREYEEKHVVDPFKGGYKSGMMGSNPFVAHGNTGSSYTEDGLRWVGSAWSEGGGRRHHKKNGHHSGDYVIVSGNPFGAGRDRVLNDEWKGRKGYDGPVRSSLTAARGHRVRNVVDQFKGRVSHLDAPLGVVNPFAVKRADGHRRRGRKSCRRDKDRRREDWDDEDCEEMKEKERPTEGPLANLDEGDEERAMEMEMEGESTMEENENTMPVEESADGNENPRESEANEMESENEGETEEIEADPEVTPANIDEKSEENGKNEENEKDEENEANEKDEEGDDEELEETGEVKEENVVEDNTVPVEESADGNENPMESEANEMESENEGEREEGEVDPEFAPEIIEEKTEENEKNEVDEEEMEETGEVKEDENVLEENTMPVEDSDDENETPGESEVNEIETENDGETEEKEAEPELVPESVDEKAEEIEENEEREGADGEKLEETTTREEASEEMNEMEEEKEEEDGSREGVESEDGEEEERMESETDEKTKTAVEETIEDGIEEKEERSEMGPQPEETEEEQIEEEPEMEEGEEKEETIENEEKAKAEEEDVKEEPVEAEENVENGEEEEEELPKDEDEGVKEMEKEKDDNGTGDTETAVEGTIEDGVEKEMEDEESTDESKPDEAELPESIEKPEETIVNGNEEEKDAELPESIEDEDDGVEKEETEVAEETGDGTIDELENREEDEESGVEKEEETGDPEDLPDAIDDPKRSRRSVVYSPSISDQSRIGHRLSIPRSSRLHRSRFSRLCASSTAGQTISIGQCRQDFVYCKSARRPVVAACPVGDLFDAVMATCVPTEICGAEKTKGEIPYVPVSLPSRDSSYSQEEVHPTMPSTTTISFDQTEKDCSSLPDGAFPVSACSSHYFVCSASVRQEYSCPEGNVYHKEMDSCELPAAVSACGVPTASDSTPSMAEQGYSRHPEERDGLATTAPTTVSPMHVHFECNKNGGFALDCKGGFVMCSNGQASFMKCPPSLVFEESTQSCEYPAKVGSCGLMEVSPLAAPSMEWNGYTSTTTATPARPVEVLVNTPVDKNACSGVSSGLQGATGDCPSSFVICKEGEVSAVMNCAEGTFFDEKSKECDYREVACAGGWSGEALGVESRVELDVPSVSIVSESEEYGRRSSRPYRPSMPVEVEKIEKEKKEVKRDEEREERPMVIPSTVEPAIGASCDWKGTAPSGICSSQFITCTNGRPLVFDCAAGLVFASSTSACEYPEFVKGCPQMESPPSSSPSAPYTPTLPPSTVSPYAPSFPLSTSSPSSTVSPLSPSIVKDESIVEYNRDETPSTTTERPFFPPVRDGDHTSATFEATGVHCTFSADRPSFPLNHCSMAYAVCHSNGFVYKTNCTFGYLFDSVIRHCVPSEHCGQSYLKDIANGSPSSSLHSTIPYSGDTRCVGVSDGTLKVTGLCSGRYIRCEKEMVNLETCSSPAYVFSPLTGRCVLRVQMAECTSSPRRSPSITRPKMVTPPAVPSADISSSSSYPTAPSHRGVRIRGGLSSPSSSTQFDARSFCTTKHIDGLYRNGENCAGIVQCFGGEAFSYPSCAPGLFFNEIDGQCDYASNVPECSSQVDPVALDDSWASCKGQPHGAYLADDSSCSIFYRCVWGSLERMACPDGTVFNPRLSMCDYPSEVPHCLKH